MVVLMMASDRLVRGSSLLGAVLLVILAAPSGSSQDRTVVRLTAERFTFTPSRVKVTRGTVIEFRLRSDDTNHGFRIVGSDASLIIPKRGRGEAMLIFHADTPGRYTFECSKMCGAGHSFMRGEIIVDDPEQQK
jgi:cytochrome c oxidase subunit 2